MSYDLRERLKLSFTKIAYRGDADDKFRQYLTKCWAAYRENPTAYRAPYVTIVQSSGFGKSRLLLELARTTKEGDEMRVLYTCTRRPRSTGYPEATTKLGEWLLFPGDNTRDAAKVTRQISKRLRIVHDYAVQNWQAVGNEWLKLFSKPKADAAVSKALSEHHSSHSRNDDKNAARMVVLVVDEARELLTATVNGVSYFDLLRNALVNANTKIGRTCPRSGIFSVMVDTNSTISLADPSSAAEESGRNVRSAYVLFPPFVLAHTMDVHWQHHWHEVVKLANTEEEADEIAACKTVVQGTEQEAWQALLSMGRPMWKSTFEASMANDNDEKTATKKVLHLAARKLLLGMTLEIQSYNSERTMFGVASMLCRLGLRPYSKSSLASRLVADFMAVLAYVNHEKDGQVSSYASDPVLSLGATTVWYVVTRALLKFILPQLKKMLLNETLDTGGTDGVVARIVLLLAMDTCVVKETKSESHKECKFTGQFVSVRVFMDALIGPDPAVKMEKQRDADKKTRKAFKKWRRTWNGYQVGFCHFVQLYSEPTEEMLWFLLGRRAAGIFPRDQSEADLVIPIFRGSEVSMVLVRVGSDLDHEDRLPVSQSLKVPSSGSESRRIECQPDEVIRVCINPRVAETQFRLCEVPNEEVGVGTTSTSPQTVKTFALFVGLTSPWVLRNRNDAEWPVIPGAEDIVKKLKEINAPFGAPMTIVRGDLDHRAKAEKHHFILPKLSKLMPGEIVLDIARKSLFHDKAGLGDAAEAEAVPGADTPAPKSSKRRRPQEDNVAQTGAARHRRSRRRGSSGSRV